MRISQPGWIVLVCLVLPVPAYGQVSHQRDHESMNSRPGHVAGATQEPDLARVEKRIVEGTNAFRAQHQQPALKVNSALTHSARSFGDFMARTDKYGHTADGKEPWQRTADYGYDDCIVAENIAWVFNSAGFSTQQLADQLLKGWERSPEHRRNMLDPDLKEIGVGVARSSRTGKYYAVQDFGRPKKDQITFQMSNHTTSAVRYTVDNKSFDLPPDYTRTHWRCRPPTVVVQLQTKKTLHPQTGTQYTLLLDQDGKLQIQHSPIEAGTAGTPSPQP